MKNSRFSLSSSSRNTGSSILFWCLLPFVGCLGGYLISGYFIQKTEIVTPLVIGKSLLQSVEILSHERLGVRLLTQKEDPSLPEATVIDQLPKPGQLIRPNQNVFVTTSTKQPPQSAPDWWGKRIKDLMPILEKQGLQVALVDLSSSYPQGMCIAQVPTAGQPLQGKSVRLYVSMGLPLLAVMPSFNGLTIIAFEKLLEKKDMRVEYIHETTIADSHVCADCIITEQHPVAGAIIDLSRTLDVQVQVRSPKPVAQVPQAAVIAMAEVLDSGAQAMLGEMPLAIDPEILPNPASQA